MSRMERGHRQASVRGLGVCLGSPEGWASSLAEVSRQEKQGDPGSRWRPWPLLPRHQASVSSQAAPPHPHCLCTEPERSLHRVGSEAQVGKTLLGSSVRLLG